MALQTFLPEQKIENKKQHRKRKKNRKKEEQKSKQPSSWDQIKNLLTCKSMEGSKKNVVAGGYSKLGSSCSSICSFKDVVHGNTRVVNRADNSPENSSVGQENGLLSRKVVNGTRSLTGGSSAARSNCGATYTSSSSSRGMQLRKLSGCYECHMIVDPSRYPTPRTRICACSKCGEVFPKIESLELHQAIRHAVSELAPEDSGRNIVEIIFKSSWLKKDSPICKIERILKVHNTQRTIQRFEECRDTLKLRANANTRCAADGNELLRFHCTTLMCALGARGTSSLCGSVPGCGVCAIIRHGFQGKATGVLTTASSGKAHDCLGGMDGRRAMLVCRVIAGRVKRTADEDAPPEEDSLLAGSCYDSVAGSAGIYSNLEELIVFNPRAILPCFVVIYKALD